MISAAGQGHSARSTRARPTGDQPAQDSGSCEKQQRDAVHAENRRVAGQRARRRLGIAGVQPRETGKQPAAQPFQQRQRSGHDHNPVQRRRQMPATAEVTGGGRKQREVGTEKQRYAGSERCRHGTEHMQADVHPGHARNEPAETESETEPGGVARTGRALPQHEQAGEGQQRQRIQRERCVTERGDCAQRCSDDPLGGAA